MLGEEIRYSEINSDQKRSDLDWEDIRVSAALPCTEAYRRRRSALMAFWI
jgi:hypothetical protein